MMARLRLFFGALFCVTGILLAAVGTWLLDVPFHTIFAPRPSPPSVQKRPA